MAIRYGNDKPATSKPLDKALKTLIEMDREPVSEPKKAEKPIIEPLKQAIEAIEYNGPKTPVSIRLDNDILDKLKSTGPKWQSRVNYMLRKALGI